MEKTRSFKLDDGSDSIIVTEEFTRVQCNGELPEEIGGGPLGVRLQSNGNALSMLANDEFQDARTGRNHRCTKLAAYVKRRQQS